MPASIQARKRSTCSGGHSPSQGIEPSSSRSRIAARVLPHRAVVVQVERPLHRVAVVVAEERPDVLRKRRHAGHSTFAYSLSSQSVTALANRDTSLRFMARNACTNWGPSRSTKNGSASSASSASPSENGISVRSSSS